MVHPLLRTNSALQQQQQLPKIMVKVRCMAVLLEHPHIL